MKNIKAAADIQDGDKISLIQPLEVIGKSLLFGSDTYSITLQVDEETCLGLDVPAKFPLAVAEPEEMPDQGEIMDRVLAVIAQCTPITKPLVEAVEHLVANHIIDIPSLIELTNEFDAFGIEPVRSCRVCGCTDDDCSQCIEASGEACHWVGEDLCSRCLSDKIDKTNNELLSDIKQNLEKLNLKP